MADNTEIRKVVSASREISAPAERIFELIADPSQQPRWDGNDNLAEARPGQRVRDDGVLIKDNHIRLAGGVVKAVTRMRDKTREMATEVEAQSLEQVDEARIRVTHTSDWSRLTDEKRLARARATTADRLQASLGRLAELAERG